MIERMLRFIRGTVKVAVSGAAVERFIDLCRLYGVSLWDITWVEEGLVTARMYQNDRRYAEELAVKAMCNAEFRDLAGLKMVLRPLKGRWALFFMAVMCTAVCFGSTLFLWKIRIEGCASISALELLGQLESMGLRRGCLLSTVDVHELQRDVMNLRDDIERITINLKGTEALVAVAEKDLSRSMGDEVGPCDIVSDKAGIIEEMQVLSGNSAAAVGDTVIPGDILVEGTLTDTQGGVHKVRSMANVTLRTWREVKIAMNNEVYALDKTGNCTEKYSIIFGNRRFELPLIEKSHYACYYKMKEIMPVQVGDGYLFPVALVRETLYECVPRRLELSEEACGKMLGESCGRAIAEMCGNEDFKETGFELFFGENGIYAVMSAECRESAGIEKAIEQTGED